MNVIVWSKQNCSYCDLAKNLLQSKGIDFEERKIDDGWTVDQLRTAIPGAGSIPQIVVDDQIVGGFKNLVKYLDKEDNVN